MEGRQRPIESRIIIGEVVVAGQDVHPFVKGHINQLRRGDGGESFIV
jgi:hypothetical protein